MDWTNGPARGRVMMRKNVTGMMASAADPHEPSPRTGVPAGRRGLRAQIREGEAEQSHGQRRGAAAIPARDEPLGRQPGRSEHRREQQLSPVPPEQEAAQAPSAQSMKPPGQCSSRWKIWPARKIAPPKATVPQA